MRAVKGSLGHSLMVRHRKLEGSRWTRAVEDQAAYHLECRREFAV